MLDKFVPQAMRRLCADVITNALTANDTEFLASPRCRLFLEALSLENLDLSAALARLQAGEVRNKRLGIINSTHTGETN